jgi:HEPN domain-containing protein/predicted nucleotidyltransferase
VAQVTAEVVDGKVRYNGRTLADWAPAVAADLVRACDPLQVILLGSVARGDDGPDSDIDVLVILEGSPPSERTALEGKLRGAVRAPVPVELHVTDRHDFERRRHTVGAIEEAAAHQGRVLHGQPLAEERWMPDPKTQAQEARRWLTRAWEDLDAAELLAGSVDLPPRLACFHAQQAAEKALKAALVHDAIRFPKTHDLQELVKALPSRWSVRNLDVDLAWLSRWALTARYPGTGSDASAEDAATATSAARRIVSVVSTDIGWGH